MLIGVDRLDYTKGLIQRMEAFDLFFSNWPDWRGKVTYLQITPKSRSEIPEYHELEQALGAVAGRINGRFGEASWTPIRYVNRAHSRSALAGLYRSARVGVVTPLRDGMNLVAKEYVAQLPKSGLQRMSRLPSWRNKWVGFHCAAIFRQTLIQPVECRANSDPEEFGLLLRHPRRQMHWLHEVLL